jgi:hypothetical protein
MIWNLYCKGWLESPVDDGLKVEIRIQINYWINVDGNEVQFS